MYGITVGQRKTEGEEEEEEQIMVVSRILVTTLSEVIAKGVLDHYS